MEHVLAWIEQEEFDTDALQQDYHHKQHDSNLGQVVGNIDQYKIITDYFDNIQLHSFTFKTGFPFNYCTEHDHNGNKTLYIKPVYDTLKREMLNNKIYPLNIHQFNLNLHKATKFIHSQRVKSMKSDGEI